MTASTGQVEEADGGVEGSADLDLYGVGPVDLGHVELGPLGQQAVRTASTQP